MNEGRKWFSLSFSFCLLFVFVFHSFSLVLCVWENRWESTNKHKAHSGEKDTDRERE